MANQSFTPSQSRSQLIPILQKVQDEKGWISDDDMQQIAEQLGIHPVEVFSVVSFYSFLNTAKRGRHTIRVSTCIPCEMAGSEKIIKAFESVLGIRVGETTPDEMFTLEKTSCIGMCDQAPAILVDDRLIGHITPERVETIVKELKTASGE